MKLRQNLIYTEIIKSKNYGLFHSNIMVTKLAGFNILHL